MTKQSKTFFATLSVVFVLVGIAACVFFRNTGEVRFSYGAYLMFLAVSGLIGGAAVSLFTWHLTQREYQENRVQKKQIAELEKNLEDLRYLAERREDFIASFAHELKTPLTAIIGYADMLRSKQMSPKAQFNAAGYIFSEGKRLESLSLKLLDIIVAGKQNFDMKPMDAEYFLKGVAAVSMPSLENAGITLDMHFGRGTILVEPDLFKTLVINLIDNARKASSSGDTIELFGIAEEKGYALYVRDHGRGMKAEDILKITEPFYMIDKSRSRAMNGAGLGVTLCQKIAELHSSTLEYESEPGQGTTVRILLKNVKDGEGNA